MTGPVVGALLAVAVVLGAAIGVATRPRFTLNCRPFPNIHGLLMPTPPSAMKS
jgi:hypothetical protein